MLQKFLFQLNVVLLGLSIYQRILETFLQNCTLFSTNQHIKIQKASL